MMASTDSDLPLTAAGLAMTKDPCAPSPRRRFVQGSVVSAAWVLSGCATPAGSPPQARDPGSRSAGREQRGTSTLASREAAAAPLNADKATERAAQLRQQTPAAALARATHLLNRLSFGPRPGDIESLLQTGEMRWIDQQLNPQRSSLPAALQSELDRLDTLHLPINTLTAEYQQNLQAIVAQQADGNTARPAGGGMAARNSRRSIIREVAYESSRARLLRAIDSPHQLEELMVDFWFNHFNVFIGKGLDRVLVGHYETHAIRPHVFGSFRELLGATAKHPAMLFYLDNAQSVGGAAVGRRPGANTGLNENYARELMELHTLGADGGYTQHDVTELARILTGWTFSRRDDSGNAFRFEPQRHDPGSKLWLGHRLEGGGQREGEFALDVLAAHPATARRIGYKLAQYFVADNPPDSLVSTLASEFSRSRGNIRDVLAVLFAAPEFWASSEQKFKTPYQFVVSSVRVAGLSLPSNVLPLMSSLNQMGMPLFGCPTPDGYANTEAAWLNAEAMTRRLNFATALATGRLPLNHAMDAGGLPMPGLNPGPGANPGPGRPAMREPEVVRPPSMPAVDWRALLATLDPLVKPRTRSVVESSALELRSALLLGSPEFMRR